MISIITPIFNGEHFIRDVASSVLSQTYMNWEWIIINDGSTDATATVLDDLDDPRIQVIHQANAGASAARNVGLERARGEYVTFLDADDLLPSEALMLRAAYLDAHQDVDIVNGGVRVTLQGRLLRYYLPDLEQGPLLDRLAQLQEGVFFNVNYMMRRARIGNQRFPEGLSHCEDLIFFLTLAHDKALQYGAISDTIYEYRVRPSSAMSNLYGVERGYMELIRLSHTLPGLRSDIRNGQLRRVRRILVRCWLARFRLDRAVRALFKLNRASRCMTLLSEAGR